MSSELSHWDRPDASRGWAPTPTHQKNRLGVVNDDFGGVIRGPSTGRTGKMGRKAERPRDAKASGPSGQHEATKHDREHTNK